MFTTVKVEEEDLVHKVYTTVVAHRANISATRKKKDVNGG